MYIGAAYYPELWDESELEKDIERCVEYGINVLRIGEFAWGRMEPREGAIQLDWLEHIIDRLYRSGIYTVLCTPTCTPPRWLFHKYPEALQVSWTGERSRVSSRCHPCKTSPAMREKNRIIVEALAKRFGVHPGIIGWQIDNELFPYNKGCYCENCKREFRNGLRKKYGTVAALNVAWGMSRWSLDYADFDEVEPPVPNEWIHPSLRTEWRRFQCRQICSYLNEQAEILHRYTKAPVGTDMMPNNTLSYAEATAKLDVVQYNHYDTAGALSQTDFIYNFIRSIKQRPFWVTETQVGWNGSHFAENGYRPRGNCYVNTMLPIAMGAEMNLYWLFRSHPNGHELAHGALFSSAGRAYLVSREIRQAAKDLKYCDAFFRNSRVKSTVALHYSSVAEHNFSSAPILKGFSYTEALKKIHAAFVHDNIDVIDTPHSLDEYRTVLSPFLTTVDEDLKLRLREWVQNGGTWIVGPMSDIMTDDTSKYTHAPFPFLEEFAGVYTKYQNPIANSVYKAEWNNGEELAISTCYDAFETTDSQSLASYRGEDFNGYAVITERRIGKGKVILLGSLPDGRTFRKLVGEPPIAEASRNVRLVRRSGQENGIIALELENQPGYVVLEQEYTELLTGRQLCGRVEMIPYQVLILRCAKGCT